MLCENCKKNTATTYFKQTVNGKTREVFLCSECAAKLGLGDSFMNFSNFGLGFNAMSELLGGSVAPSVSTCPTCGISLKEVSHSGMMGCADCYDTFRDYLRKLLPRISGNKVHTGKVPHASESEQVDDVASLKAKLAEAIKTENFEQATVLRDKIRELEAKQEKGEEA
ncbi:MAG: UvrB/UvrC motif-containing protein [Clostridia bacterium]|nr:UvrB/UvrC motif-containing protein [Clostridia bacterium]MBQ5743027.1 UvrB/UvrC motif-containing protein [Clostridia bacterium]